MQVYVWDLKPASALSSGSTRVDILRHHEDAVVAVGWSHDCASLVTCDKSGTVAVWQCQK